MSVHMGRLGSVTEIEAHDAVIGDAMAVIDQALGTMQHRELVSSDEVADLLLDLRLLLAAAAPAAPEPVSAGSPA